MNEKCAHYKHSIEFFKSFHIHKYLKKISYFLTLEFYEQKVIII